VTVDVDVDTEPAEVIVVGSGALQISKCVFQGEYSALHTLSWSRSIHCYRYTRGSTVEVAGRRALIPNRLVYCCAIASRCTITTEPYRSAYTPDKLKWNQMYTMYMRLLWCRPRAGNYCCNQWQPVENWERFQHGSMWHRLYWIM
jgi:hypothetical protein